jgi:phosphoglycerol transferase MdoB-like AlkP superfamily enzyme
MVPAIFAGLPNLMDEPYILSTYNTNKIENAFKKYSNFGYSTSFFHGSNNGTMGFNAFFKQTGLQHYFGIDEYPTKDKDYDGNWGIWDEAYLQYYANCIDTFSRPFFSSVFTLSSHHPYEIPQKYESQLPFSPRTIQRSIGYTDICLRKFFETARKKDWFKNTVFVITGDHTSHGVLEYFYSAAGHYEVPFLIYNSGLPETENHKSVSQCDILPTVSAVIQNKINLEGLGRNALDSSYTGYSMHYDNGLFYMVQYPFVMAVDNQGKTMVYQKQFRNAPKPIKLPQTGVRYNSMHNILTKYLFMYSENIKNNHWH